MPEDNWYTTGTGELAKSWSHVMATLPIGADMVHY